MSNNGKLTTTGLVIRETDVKERDRQITVFTASDGLVTAVAYGARRPGSSTGAGTRLYCYTDFTFIKSRGRWKVDAAKPLEQFFDLSKSVEALAASGYFMELLCDMGIDGQPDTAILRLALNSLFALCRGKKPHRMIKAVFELRLMAEGGFAPELDGCGGCGETNTPYFSAEDGCLYCEKCAASRDAMRGIILPVSPGALDAMRYIMSADMRRIFAFKLSDLDGLCAVCEAYVRARTEKNYASLDIYKSLL